MTADNDDVTSDLADDPVNSAGDLVALASGTEYRTTELPCVVCLTAMSLDDDRPKFGTVRWQLYPYFGLKRGRPISFRCPQGHSSEGDPELLKAFPSRTF